MLTGFDFWNLLIILAGTTAALAGFRIERHKDKALKQRIDAAYLAAEKAPDRARPAWDLAVGQMQGYFERNLKQAKSIFSFAVTAMIAGFALIGYGVTRALNDSNQLGISTVAAASGVITQLIGATFMLIYRSTLKESGHVMGILERINFVGMAVQILDAIPEQIRVKSHLCALKWLGC